MFDFRYHVVSLVAVFAALAVGILLGVTIAGKVVTRAERSLSDSLRSDLRDARGDRSDALRELRRSKEFERLVYPAIVDNRLFGMDIGIIAVGGSTGVVRDVRKALEPSGASLVSISTIGIPIRVDRLADELKHTKFAEIDSENRQLGKFAKELGTQLVERGKLEEQAKRELFSSHSGRLLGLDGVVFVRSNRNLEGEEKRTADRFESSLVKGMLDTDAPVVGVERSDNDPSQIGYYRKHDLTSVDNVDTIAGRVALVLALQGAKGHFGIRSSATQLMPQSLLVETSGSK